METVKKIHDQLDIIFELLIDLHKAKTLDDLLAVHKQVPQELFIPNHLGLGDIVRCDRVENVSEDTIFLGNIYGLWTFPIREWKTSDATSQNMVYHQYKNLLYTNLRDCRRRLVLKLKRYKNKRLLCIMLLVALIFFLLILSS